MSNIKNEKIIIQIFVNFVQKIIIEDMYLPLKLCENIPRTCEEKNEEKHYINISFHSVLVVKYIK